MVEKMIAQAATLSNHYITNVVAQGIGRIGSLLANFGVYIIVARVGGADIFGQYSYILAFSAVIAVIADFGMTPVLAKDIAQVKDSSPQQYWGNYLLLRFIFNLITVVFAAIAVFFFKEALFFPLLLCAIFMPVFSARFFEPVFQVFSRPILSSYSSLIYATIYFVLTLIAISWTNDIYTIVISFIAANMLYMISACIFACGLLKPDFTIKKDTMAGIVKLAMPLGVSSIFAMINGRIAIFMLGEMSTDCSIAMYNAAYRFVDIAALMAAFFVSPFIPVLAEKAMKDPSSLRDSTVKIMEVIAILIAPAAVICPAVSEQVVTFLFGQQFIESAQILNVLSWMAFIVFYSLFASAITLSIGVVYFAYWTTAFAVILGILLNYLWIPGFGAEGSAYAAVVCELFLAGSTIFYAVKKIGNVFRFDRWLKIILANLILWVILYVPFMDINIILRIGTAVLLYAVMIFKFDLFPQDVWLMTIYYIRQKRQNRGKD
jgi:O-antigen/teichoic acid export membrane protein